MVNPSTQRVGAQKNLFKKDKKSMKQHFIKTTFLMITLILAPITYTWAATTIPETLSVQIAKKTQSNKASKPPKLSNEEIRRFVTAIAVIKRYYIKDVKDNTLFNNAIKGMVMQLDPHSSFLDQDALKELKTAVSGEFVGVGIELTSENGAIKVISPLEGTPAFRAGIKPNDLIIKVDGQLVQNMTLREAVNHIKGKKGTKVVLTVVRKGLEKPLSLTITRDIIKIKTVKSELIEKRFGYIKITFFQGPVEKLLANAVKKLKKEAGGNLSGLILDLRSNPGGLLDASAKVADTFLDARKIKKYNDLIVYTKGRIPGSKIQFKAHAGDLLPGVPMVLLINGGSASASEIVAGALQDYKRAVIMGTRSFGKGSVQTVIPLSTNTAIKLTTALYYTPSGRVIQARGIQPDVLVPELAIKDKKNGGLIDIDEDDYRNHIGNNAKDDYKAKMVLLKKQHAYEMKLAKKDYQLYEALLMIKGLASVK